MSNPLSFSSIKLERFSKEGLRLKSATGFLVTAGNQYWLITNWHVVSGRDTLTNELLEPGLEPYALKTALHIRRGEGEEEWSYPSSTNHSRKGLTLELYDRNHRPKWIEAGHSEHRSKIDVVALPLPAQLSFLLPRKKSPLHKVLDPTGLVVFPWAELSAIALSAIDTQAQYGPSDIVAVIGYPLEWAPAGIDKPAPAFWRRSSVASEIQGLGKTLDGTFFIDPCPPEGMTGSPVVGMKDDSLKLLGIYSDSSTAGFGAHAGLVWNAAVIKELTNAS